MRLSNLLKVSGAAIVAVMIALGSRTGVQAGPAAQDTAAATVVATQSAPATMSAATMAAAASTTYPPCTDSSVIAVASPAATQAETMSALTMATQPVNDNPGYLGIQARSVDGCGAEIDAVVGAPARLALLKAGDIVVAIDGVALSTGPLTGVNALRSAIEAKKPGDTVTLTIQRAGAQMDIVVKLGQRPAASLATQAPTDQAAGGSVISTPAATQ